MICLMQVIIFQMADERKGCDCVTIHAFDPPLTNPLVLELQTQKIAENGTIIALLRLPRDV